MKALISFLIVSLLTFSVQAAEVRIWGLKTFQGSIDKRNLSKQSFIKVKEQSGYVNFYNCSITGHDIFIYGSVLSEFSTDTCESIGDERGYSLKLFKDLSIQYADKSIGTRSKRGALNTAKSVGFGVLTVFAAFISVIACETPLLLLTGPMVPLSAKNSYEYGNEAYHDFKHQRIISKNVFDTILDNLGMKKYPVFSTVMTENEKEKFLDALTLFLEKL